MINISLKNSKIAVNKGYKPRQEKWRAQCGLTKKAYPMLSSLRLIRVFVQTAHNTYKYKTGVRCISYTRVFQ